MITPGWFFVTVDFANLDTPCWLHDCPKRGKQVVISTHPMDYAVCPDCGEHPMPWRVPIREEKAS